MGDTTGTKVDAQGTPTGEMGQRHLASGERVAMRLWENEPAGEAKPLVARDYETVGYVLGGRAELEVEGRTVTLARGDSYTVPAGARHRYRILESFTAVEATSPPAPDRGRR